ncbi:carboxypeptidase-like regulatory domain-containing protein [Sphingobacterium sp. KU25419]|nr:carboxypeptidase-like regulatory domain-containing protein [Sphingobacterium sp. KU25419]
MFSKNHTYSSAFLIIILFFPIFTFAQSSKISAILVDEKTGATVNYASASLLTGAAQAYLKGTQSDDKGVITFQDVPNGTFTLRVTYVGYSDLIKTNIVVSNASNLDLGKLMLKSSGELLSEVVVEGRVPAMQIGIDRKIFNVGESLVSAGGTATDLLANVPTLQVDQDGTVSLRGSSVKI